MDLLGPKKAEGIVWSSEEFLFGSPEQEAYRLKYQKRFGRPPASGNTYDIANMWAECVRKVGDPSDYRAIIKALTSITFKGLMGTYKVDEDTHVGRSGFDYIPMRVFQIQNGKHEIIYLHDHRAAGLPYGGKFQTPPWISN
jgi:hypothetical protein